MRIPSKWAHAQILLMEWWPANGVAPRIFEKFENGKFMGKVRWTQ